MDMRRIAAVVLAGGAATRFGGRDKPALPVAGVPMLDRVLAAVDGAGVRVVVGPPRPGLPADVRCVREQPPGGGPVAAAAAGLAAVTSAAGGAWPAAGPIAPEEPAGPAGVEFAAVEFVALLAADLPYLSAEAVGVLGDAVDGGPADGAVYLDDTGRRQLLCGVWRVAALSAALAELGDPAGRSMRALVGGLSVVECRAPVSATPPWYDCDTEDDLRRARDPQRGKVE
jgi:molybdenum cofactor guanylyltransferase